MIYHYNRQTSNRTITITITIMHYHTKHEYAVASSRPTALPFPICHFAYIVFVHHHGANPPAHQSSTYTVIQHVRRSDVKPLHIQVTSFKLQLPKNRFCMACDTNKA